ncbi:hypothetical protein CgunFtcFv8_005086 [Champsocephalus gunnari]|uniref:Uncharacterized protein n=2 Tax=Champsocephalus gunnari TaxID=52237 RepID=A0AAN8CZ42_CHAGU|nr:hypothetical protein CgunFtcFv8_005086 [Champsocephalus gunnari]
MDTLEVRVDNVRPQVENFYKSITKEQLQLLEIGTPDNATKVLLAELILSIVTSVTSHLLKGIVNTNFVVTEESIVLSMGTTLTQSVADVLGLKEGVQSVSSERLKILISKEVARSLDSSLTTLHSEQFTISQHVTQPNRLNTMVGHATKMLKEFAAKTRLLCSRPKEHLLLAESKHDEDMRLARTETPEKSPSPGSSDSAKSKTVQDIINKEVKEIIGPLLTPVSDTDSEVVQSQSSQESSVLADNIAMAIAEGLEGFEEMAETSTSERTDKRKLSLEDIERKITNFFTKHFAKAWILRIFAQLKATFQKGSKADSRSSVQSLMDDVDRLLQPRDGNKTQVGDQISVFKALNTIPSAGVLVFTKELTDILLSYLLKHELPDVFPRQIKKQAPRTSMAPQPSTHTDTLVAHVEMRIEVQNKVWDFMVLMKWWRKTQVGGHSDRVQSALKDSQSLVRTSVRVVETSKETKAAIKITLQRLVSQIFMKAKVDCALENVNDIVSRLFEKTMADIEWVDFGTKSGALKDLDKAIFRDLCKVYGCAEMVLSSLYLEDPALEKHIAGITTYRLTTTPRQGSQICRFFSSEG